MVNEPEIRGILSHFSNGRNPQASLRYSSSGDQAGSDAKAGVWIRCSL